MSLPRYPNYKDSGVEWLGEVPEHWSVGGMRWLTRRYSGGTPDKTNLSYWEDGVVPWLNSGAVNDRLITEPSTYITEEAFSNSSAKWIPVGALVMALAGQGKTKGMVAQLGIQSTCNQSMAAIIPTATIAPRFLYWWLDSNYQNIRNMAGGDLRDGLNLELLGNIRCPIAPISEQIQIVEFLDRETAKIDELVAEQRRLMDLLKEKRQAVIAHAVTRGLNPDAPLRPSGIDWLGDVPAHWEVLSLRRCAEGVQTGGTPKSDLPSSDGEHDCIWFTPGDFSDSLHLTNSARRISAQVVESGEVKVFPPRSVLVVSIGATLGKVGFSSQSSSANQQINAIVPNKKVDGYFLAYSLLVKSEVMRFLSNASTIGIMNQEKTKDIWIAVPPSTEQTTITTFLDEETAKLDTLTTEAQRAIDLLQERRTALISAAVTGQIDVRSAGS